MRKSIWLLSAGLFAISTPAFAQSTDTDSQGAQPTEGATAEAGAVSKTGVEAQTAEQTNTADVGDIVVTATRRNEALSDVPLAVSAITAQTLENSGVADIRQLTQVSPSLLVSSTSSEAGAGAARIRGIGTVGDNPGLESSVAVFIDGVYRSRTGVGLTELGQIDRIEVLRGPQGTLFGRNASAGLISIITAKPSFKQQVNAELTLGNYDLRRIEVGATGGLSDQFAVRADAIYMKRDGFLTDTISGRDVNNRDRYLVRLQGLYKPNDQFSFRLIGDYSKRDEECCAATFLRARNYTLSGGNVVETPSTIAGLERALGATINDDTFARKISITPGRSFRQDVKDYGVSGEAVYDFGGAELTSITAYRYNNYIRGQDADFNNLDIIYRGDDGSAYNKFKTFSQELRLQGTTLNDRLNWLVGGYFANEKLTVADNLSYGADYERYANCLLFSSILPSVVQTSSPTCVNSTILNGTIAALPAGATKSTLQALASVPGRPGFGSLAATLGLGPSFSFNGVGLRDVYDQNSRNFAVFTHNIFSITDSLKLTLGARYTRERKTLDATFSDNNDICRALTALNGTLNPLAGLQALQQLPCVIPSVPGGSLSLQNGKRTESKLSGTAVLSWKPSSDILTYLSYSRGYKAGGFNLDRSAFSRTLVGTAPGGVTSTASLNQLEFKPEINDALELGMKYNGRGIDVNVAAFNQLFRDFQLNTFNGLNFFVENINSCSKYIFNQDHDNNSATGSCAKDDLRAGVRSRGVEVEVFTRPITDVSINVGGTWTSTKYRQNLVGVDGRALSNALFQLAQRRVSNSAALALTGSASFTPQITDSGIRALFYVDARHTSQYNTGSDLDLEKLQPAYTVVNARVGLTGPKGIWGVELWAQNLFNEDFLQVAFDATLQGSGTYRAVRSGFTPTSSQLFGAFLGEPRTYGVTVRTRF
jgi:outer membrane receptor protein involved in Fe transport